MTADNPDRRPDTEFALAEFVQLHEHMRQRDGSMIQLVTVLLVAATAIVSGGTAYVFQAIAENKPTPTSTAYGFLMPLAILIPGLAILRSHRKSIHRMATYIKVFIEEPPLGAQWQHALFEFKRTDPSESFDYVPLCVWTLAILCFLLFWTALVAARAAYVHWLGPLPLALIIGIHHWRFVHAKRSEDAEAVWRAVRAGLQSSHRTDV